MKTSSGRFHPTGRVKGRRKSFTGAFFPPAELGMIYAIY